MCSYKGKIYASPCVASVLLVYDPATDKLSGVEVLAIAQQGGDKFRGICGFDDKIYALPGAGSKLLVYDTALGSISGVDISTVADCKGKFTGACECGGRIYGAPGNSDSMLRYDPKKDLVEAFDVTSFCGSGGKFSAICSLAGTLYLSPQNADFMLTFDTLNGSFRAFDIRKFASGNGKFASICVVGDLIYMTPCNAACVLVFNPVTEIFTPIGLDFLWSKETERLWGACEAEGRLYAVGCFESFMLVLGDFDPWEHVEQLESQEAVPPEVLAEAQAKRRNASLNLGISLQYLLSGFIEEALGPDETGEATKFYDIAKTFACGERSPGFRQMCPRDGLPHCSLVDAQHTSYPDAGGTPSPACAARCKYGVKVTTSFAQMGPSCGSASSATTRTESYCRRCRQAATIWKRPSSRAY